MAAVAEALRHHMGEGHSILIDRARELASRCFGPRAAGLDKENRFPFENYDDLREAGFLG